jgi:hypothetical protein
MFVGRPKPCWTAGSIPAASGTTFAGAGSIPIARIRARCAAVWVFAQGKSGPDGKYWTSSCMYRPDGSVIPPYSTWQPTEGKITPMATADHRATRRLVDPRGVLLRGNPIVSTLLGEIGGPSRPSIEGRLPPSGVQSWSRPPEPARRVQSRAVECPGPLGARSDPTRYTCRRGRRVPDMPMESAEFTASGQ